MKKIQMGQFLAEKPNLDSVVAVRIIMEGGEADE